MTNTLNTDAAPVTADRAATQTHRSRGSRVSAGLLGAVTAIAFVAALTGGAAGVAIGVYLSHPAVPGVVQAAPPSAEEVRVATVDLCTAFTAAYVALPSPQKTVADVLPATTYISDALRADSVADGEIRGAVDAELRLARQQAAALSHEPAAGAIQPGERWSQHDAEAANDAAERVLTLCRSYQP